MKNLTEKISNELTFLLVEWAPGFLPKLVSLKESFVKSSVVGLHEVSSGKVFMTESSIQV